MPAYDKTLIQGLLAAADGAATNDAKGKAFEDLAVTSQKYRLFRFLVRASRDLWAFLLGEGRFPRHSHLSPEDPKYRDEWHGSW